MIRALAGIVDIYLTDFKYMDPALAAKYSAAPDYPEVAKGALGEMADKSISNPQFQRIVYYSIVFPPCHFTANAAKYSAAPDYPEVAKGALGEMADTVGEPVSVSPSCTKAFRTPSSSA